MTSDITDIYGQEKQGLLRLKQCGFIFGVLLVFLLLLLLLSPVALKMQNTSLKKNVQALLNDSSFSGYTIQKAAKIDSFLFESGRVFFLFDVAKKQDSQNLFAVIARMQTIYGAMLGVFMVDTKDPVQKAKLEASFVGFFDEKNTLQKQTVLTLCKEQIKHWGKKAYTIVLSGDLQKQLKVQAVEGAK